jgi:hypothetical protein
MQHRPGINRTIQPEFGPGHSVDEVVVDEKLQAVADVQNLGLGHSGHDRGTNQKQQDQSG